MKNRFYPDYFARDFMSVDLEALKNRGVKGIIADIDNTLVPPSQKEPDKNIKKWIERVKKYGFKISIVSNGTKKRVELFNRELGLYAVYRASKPGYRSFLKAVESMGTKPEQTCVIGDQVFTDVYGGKRLSMVTVLVKPIVKREFIFVRFKRIFEKLVIKGWDDKWK